MASIPTHGTSRPYVLPSVRTLSPPDRTKWQDLGEVETIANTNRPPISRVIIQLQPYGHRIFLGYGEWDYGLDYCDLIAWNTEAQAFEQMAVDVATDAFWTLRVVNNELWALVTDPSVGTDPDAAVFDGQITSLVNSSFLTPWHLFEILEWHGAIFLAGANRAGDESTGCVWSSADGGKSWGIALETSTSIRIHGLFPLDDLLYAVGLQGETWTTKDGSSWITAPMNLLPRGSICVRPIVFADQAFYLNGWSPYGPQDLCAFDGEVARLLSDVGGVFDVYAEGSTSMVLTADQRILQSVDLVAWDVTAADVPPTGRSLCTLNSSLYVGTTDSHLWRMSL